MLKDTEKQIREVLESEPHKADKVLEIVRHDEEAYREERRRRQLEGIEKAREKHIPLGRPKKPLPEGFEQIYHDVTCKLKTKKEVARELGMSTSNLNKLLGRYRGEIGHGGKSAK